MALFSVFVIPTLVVISGVWVYLDATKHKIGRIPDRGGLFNMQAGAWGVVTVWIWLAGFVGYLYRRRELIELARQHPVEVKGRAIKAILLALISWPILAGQAAGRVIPELPQCHDAKVTALTEKLVRGQGEKLKLGLTEVVLLKPKQLSLEKRPKRRVCRAALDVRSQKGGLEHLQVEYTVRWQNKFAGEFLVEERVLPPTERAAPKQ